MEGKLKNRFQDQVALITGGGAGIGLETAMRMAAEGASIAIADINKDRATEAQKKIQAIGSKALAIKADVTNVGDNERIVQETIQAFSKLDILVTCAGIGSAGNVVETTEELWDKVINLDLKGVFLASKYAVPEMQKSGEGSIVHLSSIGGLCGSFSASFAAAKAGVINLTRSMAVSHAHENIRVNCVCPGVIKTPLTENWLSDPETMEKVIKWHPMNRIGTVEEAAAPIVFLASREASFISGAVLTVDGGYAAAGHRD